MPLTDLQSGDPVRLGRYRLIGRLGSGGMGLVFLGTDPTGRTAAVKTLIVPSEPEARRRMTREVAALSCVTHPRLTRLLDSDLAAAVPWLAMEYAEGPSLDQVAVPLGETALAGFATGLAEALAALHAVGIVHRDLKPSNVVLTFEGPVLVDLGIARDTGSGSGTSTLTQVGTVIGSPGWMTPEQLMGGQAEPSADVWGWGALVAYAATGRPPFGAGDPNGVGWRVLNAEPDLDAVPGRWLPLVRSALRKDPAERPSAAWLSGTLGGSEPGRPFAVAPLPPSPHTETILPTAVTEVIPVGPAPGRAPSRRRTGLLAGLAAAVVAAGLGGFLLGGAAGTAPESNPLPVPVPAATSPAGPGAAESTPVQDTGPADEGRRGRGRGGRDDSGSGGSGSGGSGSGGSGRGGSGSG